MCTGIRLLTENNKVIYARTLEFAHELKSNILFIPKNYSFTGVDPDGNYNGLKWQSKYSVLGTNTENIIDIIDGVNEAGLAGGLFYFYGYAEYQDLKKEEYSKSIASWQILTWILTNFASIEEVKNSLPKIKVSKAVFQAWGIIIPVHVIVHDSFGKSLVIEYVNGELHLIDNVIGTFTNSPEFNWHLTNLNNYVNLSAFNSKSVQLKDIKLTPLGQGSGMLGLPGDFTSPSRFIRAAAYQESAVKIANEKDAIDTAFHILNLFDIPYGAVRQKDGDKIYYEFTQWTSCIDIINKKYYIHTCDNRIVQEFDLNSINKPELSESIIIALK